METLRILELSKIDESRIILENYKQMKAVWLKREPDVKEKDIEKAFELFKDLKSRNILKGKDADVSAYQTFSLFKGTIDSAMNQKTKREKVKDAKVWFENDDYRVIEPRSYEASCKHGSGTNWCISVPSNDEHYRNYKLLGIKFLFIQDFKNEEKYALAIYPHAKGEKPDMEGFDQNDNEFAPTGIISQYNIKKEWYSNIVSMDDWSWFVNWLEESHTIEIIDDKKIINIKSDYEPSKQIIDATGLNFKNANGWRIGHCYGEAFLDKSTQIRNLDANGIPRIIGKSLFLSGEEFKTFIGGPTEVKGDIWAEDCLLHNLNGLPKLGRRSELSFDYNFFTDLTGLPKEIYRFSCVNGNLKSLKGCPEIVNHSLIVYGNKIETLDYLPKIIKGEFWFSISIDLYVKKFKESDDKVKEYIMSKCKIKRENIIFNGVK